MHALIDRPSEAIHEIMVEKGWSQNRLAREAGVSQSLISKVLSNPESRLNARSITKLMPFSSHGPSKV